MRVTLFGAAFDPPHLGHQQIVVSLIKENLTDVVWLVPVKKHPFGKQLAPAKDRLTMTELLAESIRDELLSNGNHQDQETIKVNTFELDESGISFTFRTLTSLSTKHPEHQFSFVIGSDNLATFHKWDQYDVMLAQFPFFVYPRHGFAFAPLRTGMTPMFHMSEVRVSSTQIREKRKVGERIDELVPTSIADYIREYNLYL